MHYFQLASHLLRVGLAGSFMYAAIASILVPEYWVTFLPPSVSGSAFAPEFLYGFAAFQVIVSFWLLTGRKPVWSGLVSAFTVLIIVVENVDHLDVIFRDIAILLMALAFAALHAGLRRLNVPMAAFGFGFVSRRGASGKGKRKSSRDDASS